jgi:hypothetical protein
LLTKGPLLLLSVNRYKRKNMKKQTITAAILSFGAVFALAAPARADIILTLPTYYDSPNGYDYINTTPPAGSTTIGTFNFTIPAGDQVTGITISGTFGNPDNQTTALSDYYLGFSGNETAVEVAACDNGLANCASNPNGPTSWTYSLTSANISALVSGLSNGSLDFTYTWDTTPAFAISGIDQYVYAGAPTLDIQLSPEPASLLFCFGGLAGIAALRRFRKV